MLWKGTKEQHRENDGHLLNWNRRLTPNCFAAIAMISLCLPCLTSCSDLNSGRGKETKLTANLSIRMSESDLVNDCDPGLFMSSSMLERDSKSCINIDLQKSKFGDNIFFYVDKDGKEVGAFKGTARENRITSVEFKGKTYNCSQTKNKVDVFPRNKTKGGTTQSEEFLTILSTEKFQHTSGINAEAVEYVFLRFGGTICGWLY